MVLMDVKIAMKMVTGGCNLTQDLTVNDPNNDNYNSSDSTSSQLEGNGNI